ncbi:hypothetical protein Dvina_41280 [Dactylosporangium vinaceum]|uniref:Uncharacterized protein n=1 Tax=Dactylosporangium vinaceum TaxID=53362 RepID=A0ABV5MPZ3_9ACTN|nr:hypothetical protein [Dactylosporangium vinaceum]UAB94513.1 hypothetical protein Dvina_41280 [Dactylosporangium vinaceum]
MASHAADPPEDRLARLLHRELRTARSDALEGGADPDEITADLTERIQRLRSLNNPTADGDRGSAPT